MNKLIRRVRDHGHLLGWEASTVRVYMSGRISGFPFFFILQQLTAAVEQPFWIFGASIKVPQLLDLGEGDRAFRWTLPLINDEGITIRHYIVGFSDDEVDRDENDRLGVYWLIKASEQGHVEATNMLKNCLETGRGD
ncbi:unnamed protein product [Nesidiocoris tenuis]|uniref:Uncharacterized protein n=1 Tax=Nesidiocoris tenuis TaxID=355587 RepID=A0A6H5GR98_9HEMI|nr:unnamed protein product [Nesidiocoris tenuis]